MTTESEKTTIASVHIPKTAGTSVRKFWADTYGSGNVARYSIETDKFHILAEDGKLGSRSNPIFYSIRDTLVKTEVGKMLYRKIRSADRDKARYSGTSEVPKVDVIHGHFQPSKILESGKEFRLVTLIRDPLERAVSGFYFLQKVAKADFANNIPNWYEPDMDLKDFLELDHNENFQSKFIEERFEIFDVVGTTNNVPGFCYRVAPFSRAKVHQLNSGNYDHANLPISANDIKDFQRRNKEDYRLYEHAKKFDLN